jgi:hypothetical protein
VVLGRLPSGAKLPARPPRSAAARNDVSNQPHGRRSQWRIEIYIMDADGTGEKKLTQNRVGDYDPAWRPVQ